MEGNDDQPMRNWAVKPSDFAHQIKMTSSFEHWSESTTCEASSERQSCHTLDTDRGSVSAHQPAEVAGEEADWEMVIDSETHQKFWVNHAAKTISMEEPECLRALQSIPNMPPLNPGRPISFPGAFPAAQSPSSDSGWLSRQALSDLSPDRQIPVPPASWHGGTAAAGQNSPFFSMDQTCSGAVKIDLVVIEGDDDPSVGRRKQSSPPYAMSSTPSPAGRKSAPGSGSGSASGSSSGGRGLLSKLPSFFSKKSSPATPLGKSTSLPPVTPTSEAFGVVSAGGEVAL